MIYKWHINEDFKLVVKTQLFLTFDMYVMTFKNPNSDFFYNDIATKLFNNEQDIDVMNYWYNPTKIIDSITNINDAIDRTPLNVGKKEYSEIEISSHNDLYDMEFGLDITDVFVIQIKKFDKDNYICPIAINVDSEYLIYHDHHLDLSYMLQEQSNVKQISDLMGNFRKAIFI